MKFKNCLYCKGTGQVPFLPDGANSRCPVCKGRRTMGIPDRKQVCPVCLGAKKVPVKAAGLTLPEPCATCNETGFVDA